MSTSTPRSHVHFHTALALTLTGPTSLPHPSESMADEAPNGQVNPLFLAGEGVRAKARASLSAARKECGSETVIKFIAHKKRGKDGPHEQTSGGKVSLNKKLDKPLSPSSEPWVMDAVRPDGTTSPKHLSLEQVPQKLGKPLSSPVSEPSVMTAVRSDTQTSPEQLSRKQIQSLPDRDRQTLYKRGSIVDRFRRASMFDEIIQEYSGNLSQKNTASHRVSAGEENRITKIQKSSSFGISQDHRARMIAFEMAAERIRHHERDSNALDGDGDDEWVGLNPFCVASMPEEIRRGFLQKVFGIILTQLALMLMLVCVVKFTAVGVWLEAHYWVYLALNILPYISLACLLGLRKVHPWNLVAFSAFTVTLSVMVGMFCYFVDDSLFIAAILGCMGMLGGIVMVTTRSLESFASCATVGIVVGSAVCSSVFSALLYPGKLWFGYIWPGIGTLLFGAWIVWDIFAVQIDLTPDEYIIGAADIYLDIVNMFLWTMFCCLYCVEVCAKCAH